MITARVRCIRKDELTDGENRTTIVVWEPDYQAGLNQEWGGPTPSLHFELVLHGTAADQFAANQNYTLTVTKENTP